MIDLTIILTMDFAHESFDYRPGLMSDASMIADLTPLGLDGFGGISRQVAHPMISMGLETMPIPEMSNGLAFDCYPGALMPDHIGSTLSGNTPQFNIPFGVDGESKLARENAKEEQIWT